MGKYISTRDISKYVELVNFKSNGDAVLVVGSVHKTSNKSLIFDFTSPYVYAKGKWVISDNYVNVNVKVLKNNLLKNLPVNTEIKPKYSLLGDKIFNGENILTKINDEYKFIDNLKLFGEPSVADQIVINKILYVLKKDNEITAKALTGVELTDEEKRISNIDIDAEFLEFTKSEIVERDNLISNYQ